MRTENVNRILAETPKIYDEISADFSATRANVWDGFSDLARHVRPGDRILDLGCGNGRMAQLFADMDIEYLGLDNSDELIGIAQDRYKGKKNFKFEVGDVLNLNASLSALSSRPKRSEVEGSLALKRDFSTPSGLPDFGRNDNTKDQFDLVLMVAMLHHIPTRERRLEILKSVFAAMKPGGRIAISNWNLWKINGRKKFRYYPYLFNYAQKIKFGACGISDAFVPWKGNLRQEGRHDRYVHSIGKAEMKNLLRQAGFTIEAVNYANKNGNPAHVFTAENLLARAVKK